MDSFRGLDSLGLGLREGFSRRSLLGIRLEKVRLLEINSLEF